MDDKLITTTKYLKLASKVRWMRARIKKLESENDYLRKMRGNSRKEGKL